MPIPYFILIYFKNSQKLIKRPFHISLIANNYQIVMKIVQLKFVLKPNFCTKSKHFIARGKRQRATRPIFPGGVDRKNIL